jgi:UDP-glucose 4-epimerase
LPIAKFIKDGVTKKILNIYGDGTQTRDFVHVDDLCHAIYSVLSPQHSVLSPDSSVLSPWGETFHLGTSSETSVLELAELVQELFEKKVTISFAPARQGEIKRNYSDITKAKKTLGFSPQVALRDGVKEVYKWMRGRDVEQIKSAVVVSGGE